MCFSELITKKEKKIYGSIKLFMIIYDRNKSICFSKIKGKKTVFYVLKAVFFSIIHHAIMQGYSHNNLHTAEVYKGLSLEKKYSVRKESFHSLYYFLKSAVYLLSTLSVLLHENYVFLLFFNIINHWHSVVFVVETSFLPKFVFSTCIKGK